MRAAGAGGRASMRHNGELACARRTSVSCEGRGAARTRAREPSAKRDGEFGMTGMDANHRAVLCARRGRAFIMVGLPLVLLSGSTPASAVTPWRLAQSLSTVRDTLAVGGTCDGRI